MREIIFRGKDPESGEWYYGYYVKRNDGDRGYLILEDYYLESYEIVKPETICQYTGLTDKNGRKIFEGDIIHGNLGNFVVRWSDNISGFVAGEKERTHPCLNRGTMKCYKVIGNIYDNPELMGGNK